MKRVIEGCHHTKERMIEWITEDVSACGLDPCPFCGGEGMRDITPWDGKVEQQYFIRCRSCAATGGWAKNPHGAVRWWNMRDKKETP